MQGLVLGRWEAAEGDSSREEGSGAALASERRWRRSGAGVGAALVAEQRSGACGGVERRSVACGNVEQAERPWWRSGGAALAAVVEQAERRDGSAGVRRGAWWRDAVVRAGRVDADAVHGGATCATGGDELASRDAATTRDAAATTRGAAATQATVDGANRALRAMLGKTAGLRPEGQGDSVVDNRGLRCGPGSPPIRPQKPGETPTG
ncbi:hypothetical protein U1Q18_031060 [Sarracenia purpurea var. burkii]